MLAKQAGAYLRIASPPVVLCVVSQSYIIHVFDEPELTIGIRSTHVSVRFACNMEFPKNLARYSESKCGFFFKMIKLEAYVI